MSDPASKPSPRFGLGTIVAHPLFGRGRLVGYEEANYLIVFKGGETKRVAFDFEPLKAEEPHGDPATDRLLLALREMLGDYGWLDVELELGKRWTGGTLKLIPGKEDAQPKEVPLEMLFKKLIALRDKLRVLEQKINAHPRLTPEDKLELEGYITRCYGSLTTFNVLFAAKESQFKGQGKDE